MTTYNFEASTLVNPQRSKTPQRATILHVPAFNTADLN